MTQPTPTLTPPPRSAPFADKMAYYRSQHTSRGIRLTHLVGIPGVAFSLPVMFARPKVGVPVFLASWALQVAGHKVFEKNNPALTNGFFTYQLCGLAFWCEEMADLLAGHGLPGDAGAPESESAPEPQAATGPVNGTEPAHPAARTA